MKAADFSAEGPVDDAADAWNVRPQSLEMYIAISYG
jgi:hypothetical protein